MPPLVLMVLSLYLAVGALFGVLFSVVLPGRGAARLAPGARGASLGFRLVLVPGAALLWPYLLLRVLRAPAEGPTR